MLSVRRTMGHIVSKTMGHVGSEEVHRACRQ